MFYEGTEKRLLICTKTLNLFDFEDGFWHQLVAYAGAEVLSCIQNSTLKAYLLSESSLFVWQDRLLLITCGNTQLVKAALFVQQQLTKQHISTLIFQRHQALKPQLQQSDFQQDCLLLQGQFNGHQQHWNSQYQGDLFVFGDVSKQSITTQSIYMLHGLQGALATSLRKEMLHKVVILEKLKLTQFFNGLTIDHFSFSPTGYSLNAIDGEQYIAIHLTPEQLSTYLSIETSFSVEQCADFIDFIKTLFLPKDFKQMHFATEQQQLSIKTF